MPCILHAKKSVAIDVIGENLFLLDFCSIIDWRHALLDGPWSFFKDLVIFKAPVGLQKPGDLVFDEISMWIQCHNLPLAFMHAPILSNIGERIGRVLEVDDGDDGRCAGKFARIRVALDINKPLRQGIWVQSENEVDEICILLLYERLPNFCYNCGRIGHVLKDCVDKEFEGTEPTYGSWIRAPAFFGDRKASLPKASRSPRSGTPRSSSQEIVGDFLEPSLIVSTQKKLVETSSSKEKNESAENNIFNLEKQHILQAAPKMVTNAKVMERSSEKEQQSGIESEVVGKKGNRKWKRLARERLIIPMMISDGSPSMNISKRTLQENEDLSEGKKKTRVEQILDSEQICDEAAAAISMNCMVWNAWGLGNQRALRNLRRLIAARYPSLLFISVTILIASQCCGWSVMCLLYKFSYASTSHSLLFCKFVRKIWKKTVFWCILRHLDMVHFVDCGLAISKSLKQEEMQVFAMMVWASSNDIWKLPLPSQLRLDVDAGYDENENVFNVGVVVRDFYGRVQAAHKLASFGLVSKSSVELINRFLPSWLSAAVNNDFIV